MKKCIKCNVDKDLAQFYKHKGMKDGRLNKCKDCCKKESRDNQYLKSQDEEWVLKERERSRDKYHRLNYSEKQKDQVKKYPWKKSFKIKNLNRNLKVPKGFECHHWNYNDDYLEDVFILDKKTHSRLHTKMYLDLDLKIFISKEDNILLDTREKHSDFIDKFLKELK